MEGMTFFTIKIIYERGAENKFSALQKSNL